MTDRSDPPERRFDILVLDDDEGARASLSALFESNRCLVRVVASVGDASAALRERVPDVLVSGLPLGEDRSAWTFAKRMREDPRTRRVARVALAPRIDHGIELARTFDAYLPKPTDTSLLLVVVWQLVLMRRELLS